MHNAKLSKYLKCSFFDITNQIKYLWLPLDLLVQDALENHFFPEDHEEEGTHVDHQHIDTFGLL